MADEVIELEGKPAPEQEAVVIDEKREKALIAKIDRHIVPFLVGLYLFSFLDRGLFFCLWPSRDLTSN